MRSLIFSNSCCVCKLFIFIFNHILTLHCTLFFKLPSTDYMVQKLGVEEKQVPEMNHVLYKNYGTTLAGLKVYIYSDLILLFSKRRKCSQTVALFYILIIFPFQAIGYNFDYDDYHRYQLGNFHLSFLLLC